MTNQSLTLQYFNIIQAPLVFGRLRSIATASNICAGVLILSLAPFLSYKQLYLLVGLIIIAAALWCFTQQPTNTTIVPQHNNIVNFFLSPLIGICINRFGERKVLSLEYSALIIIFVMYAIVDSKLVAAFLYIADHIFFNFAIAIRTFFQKIAEPEDIAPSMAVGFTINHIAAVFLPVAGGLLWLINYKIPFFAGAVLSFLSLILVQCITAEMAKNPSNTNRQSTSTHD